MNTGPQPVPSSSARSARVSLTSQMLGATAARRGLKTLTQFIAEQKQEQRTIQDTLETTDGGSQNSYPPQRESSPEDQPPAAEDNSIDLTG